MLKLQLLLQAKDFIGGKLKLLGNRLKGVKGISERASKALRSFARVSGFNRLAHRVKGVRAQLDRVKQAAASAFRGLAVGGVGLGYIIKQFIDAGSTVERLQIRLNALLGSAEEGQKLFKAAEQFEGKTPFDLESIISGAARLSSVLKGGVSEIQRFLPIVGDLAGVTNLSFEETADQVARLVSAGAGAADRFRELGTLSLLGFKAGASTTGKQAKKLLIKAFEADSSLFRGSAEKLRNTFGGLISQFVSKWFKFRKLVAESGPFEALKTRLDAADRRLQEMFDDGRIKTWAAKVGAGISKTIDLFEGLVRAAAPVAKFIGEISDLIGPTNTAFLLLGVTILPKLLFGVVGLAHAFTALGWSIAATPLGLLLIGLTGIGYAIVKLVSGIRHLKPTFGEMLKGWVAFLIKWNPLAILLRIWNWVVSKITDFDLLGMLKNKLAGMDNFIGRFVRKYYDDDGEGAQAFQARRNPRAANTIPGLGGVTRSGNAVSGQSIGEMLVRESARRRRTEVGGSLNIRIDQEGRARIARLETTGPMDIGADMGMAIP